MHPTEPAPEHGWIEPGEPVGWTGRGAVHRVRAFHEHAARGARAPAAGRALCNTFVFTATVTALVDAGLACLPLLHDRLTRFDLFAGTRYETIALQQAYLFAPTADFSRAILASAEVPLAVVEIPALTWWDLGTPERGVPRCRGGELPANDAPGPAVEICYKRSHERGRRPAWREGPGGSG